MGMIHMLGKNTKSWVKCDTTDPNIVQPNCLELKVKRLIRVDLDHDCLFDNDTKRMRPVKEVEVNIEGYWCLEEGLYEIIYDIDEVYIAEGEAGWVMGRSSFRRNGITLESSLYDSGFHSTMLAGTLRISGGGNCFIKPGTRIGQFILMKAEALKMYDGDWGIDPQTNKSKDMEESRYN